MKQSLRCRFFEIARCLVVIIVFYGTNSLISQSVSKLEESIRQQRDRLSSASDAYERFNIYSAIADTYYQHKALEEALAYGDTARGLIQLMSDSKYQLSAYIRLLDSPYPAYQSTYDEAHAKFEGRADRDLLLMALSRHHALLSPQNIRNDFRDALLDQISIVQDDHAKAILYYGLSSFYNYSEMLQKLTFLNKAESLVDTTLASSIDLLVDLGVLYDELEIPDRSLELGLKAYRLADNFDDSGHKVRPLYRIISIAAAIDAHELVERYAQYGIDLFEEIDLEGSLGWMYGLRGFSRLKEGQIDEAISDFQSGIDICEQYNVTGDLGRCLEGMALANLTLGDINLAKSYAEQALKVGSIYCEHCQELAFIYSQSGDYQTAAFYQEKTINALSRRETAYNKYQIASELLNENFEQERSALEQSLSFRRKANVQNILLTAGAALLMFLTFLYFYQRKRNRIRNRMLQTQVAEQTEEITLQKEKLEQLDRVKTKLYTNITHEFRTPLTVISGIAENIKSEAYKKELGLILRNSSQLLNLVNQMLDLRKLESGTIKLNMVQTDMVQYLRYLTESFNSLGQHKNVEIHFLPEVAELWMDTDLEKLTRIHTNLLSNAMKFTPENGHIYIQLYVKEVESDEFLHYQIRDTGIGIAEEDLEHIFDRFYQIDDSATREGEGTGIGLTLVLEMVKVLGGTIEVQSMVGQGTTFTITLAITRASQKTEDLIADSQVLALSNVGHTEDTLHIDEEILDGHPAKPLALVIEDNIDVIYYITDCLRSEYQLQIALNGEEGIEKALEFTPDIVLSDVMMPIQDGLEVCRTLKSDQRTSHIPIVLLTAKADVASKIEGLEHGADAYISKPFHKQELLVTMQGQIQLRKKLQQYFNLRSLTDDDKSGQERLLSQVTEMNVDVEDAFLQAIRTLVEEDLSSATFGMLQLMRGLGMSRSQIYKKVKALTGDSPSIYMRKIRLRHAKELLKDPNLNVSEVAYSVGFDSAAYFSDVFLEEYGHRPSEMRNLNS